MGRVLMRSSDISRPGGQEFEFTEKDFKYIQWFLHKNVGIFLSDQKRAMVYGRISRQLRALKLRSFGEYQKKIENDTATRIDFINSLTTNKTHFFREYHHFEYFEKVMLDEWRHTGKKRIRIWSAGCSTGEEPYSFVASMCKEGVLDWCDDLELLASDLDTSVLKKAQLGEYTSDALNSIPDDYLKPCFLKGVGSNEGKIKFANVFKKLIQFKQINLLESWPIQDKFDLISCRNVMIYFDKPTQEKLIRRYHQQLNPQGVLFIGHSETVGECADLFHNLGNTIYVKQ